MMGVITLKCGTQITLTELENANISYVPCGCVDGEDKPLLKFGHLWGHRKRVTHKTYGRKFNSYTLSDMTGVQLMTGFPTYRRSGKNDFLYYTSIDIERQMVEAFPDEVAQIQRLYCENVEGTPCRLATKSEGLRLDAYTPYVGKKMSFKDDAEKMLLEILADKCLARIDARYAMLEGSLLDIPALPKETLQDIYGILADIATQEQSDNIPREVVENSQLGVLDIEWDSNGYSQYFPSEHCQCTSHQSNRDTVRFKRHTDGSVHGKCFNCGESWWEIAPLPQHKRGLLITGEYNENLVTLAENQQMIVDAFTDGVSEADGDTPHYHILNFEMGSGKNHAFLTTLETLKKSGIGIFENHEQVDEQVDKAFNLHGLRAMGFRGRGYKFQESELSGVPVNMRQQDTDIFDKNGVVCAFYDQIEKWQKKGLAAYEYCLGCPFFDKGCRYLPQFKTAQDMDFLAICLHDLFFDPGLWNFLEKIWMHGEETEEEQIIGAALGVGEKTTSMAYDLGVVDEVVARNLYLSYEYALQDFDELATAWDVAALGDFLTEILRCLRDTTEGTDPLPAVKAYMETVDDETRLLVCEQMTQIPKKVDVYKHILRDKDTHEVWSEYYVVDNAENEWVIPVSKDAEHLLRKKKVPTLAYRAKLPRGKIGMTPYAELRNGKIRLSEIPGRIWLKDWTLLNQLEKTIKLNIERIGTKYTTKGEEVCCDTVTLTIPPQVNSLVKTLVLMGANADVENIKMAFDKQKVKLSVSKGKRATYAKNVKNFQYTGGRVTQQSVFEIARDSTGQPIYEKDSKSPVKIGIKPTALKDLNHFCLFAERHIAEGNPKPVFVSWKDFTQPPIADTEIGKRMHSCLRITHFDMARGLNFEGVKFFLSYGYPKSADPDVVKETAETLHHADPNRLDFTYERGNEVSEGYEVYQIGRYRDPRVDAVRQQLTREKVEQIVYRSRPTRWEDTTTCNFSAEPIPGWTERATPFTREDFLRAESFEEIEAMKAERTALTAENSIEDFQRVYRCSKRHARRLWEQAGGKETAEDNNAEMVKHAQEMKAQGIGERKIAKRLGISYGKLRRILEKHKGH